MESILADHHKVEVLGIDIARFVAATLVVMWHFAGKPFLVPATATLQPLMPATGPTVPPAAMLTSLGWIGVQIFFVISGAVIAFSATRSRDRRAFFINRFARLWPGMLASALICSAMSLIFWNTGIVTQTMRLIGSVVFSPIGPWFSGQVWTLPVEVAFYVIVGAIVVGKEPKRLESLAWGLALWSAAYWLIRTLSPSIMQHFDDRLQNFVLLLHGCYFALGIAIAMASAEGYNLRLSSLIGLTAITAFLEIATRATEELGNSPYRPDVLFPIAAWCFAVIFIIASFAYRDLINAMVGRAASFVQMLGTLTYPLYLVHYQTGGPLYAYLIKRGWSVWDAFVPAYAVALACAFVIALYVERPMQRLIKNALQKRGAGSVGNPQLS